MSLLLDKHYSQITKYIGKISNVKISKVSKHFDNVVKNLDKEYWEKWRKISIEELSNLAEQNKFEEIAYYMTLPDLYRFKAALEDFKKNYDINQLTELNIEKAKEVWKEEVVLKAIDMFINSMSLWWKSLYETMFYYLWGRNTRSNSGLALWFDRDHDLFQVEAFSLGYKPEIIKSMVPLLYARRTGKKSWNKLNELSFRQFWHYYD